ncbi:hypothetical protein HanRHA438_Chr01g0033351 [Helianthus annuus]|uniref:Uncharacterized protein n=1 Tax=Helianthus annuus TaxID=4232 RepID=A0A9K3P599_HELAN|nr:hypothetical protein HanXRQr2_Chr01g0032731 [Helianthus annuus]KAJ0948947.1 hypothetical protein HanRHA438_Chr01g0033351 [Helianthus annuus]
MIKIIFPLYLTLKIKNPEYKSLVVKQINKKNDLGPNVDERVQGSKIILIHKGMKIDVVIKGIKLCFFPTFLVHG